MYSAAKRPRRSVVFALWTVEEKGLLGASWYANHPVLPLATTAAQFNLDPHVVLGRTRNLELIGVGRTPLEADLTRVAAAQGLAIVPKENTEAGWYYRSDHYALAQKGVPGVYLRAGRNVTLPTGASGRPRRSEKRRAASQCINTISASRMAKRAHTRPRTDWQIPVAMHAGARAARMA